MFGTSGVPAFGSNPPVCPHSDLNSSIHAPHTHIHMVRILTHFIYNSSSNREMRGPTSHNVIHTCIHSYIPTYIHVNIIFTHCIYNSFSFLKMRAQPTHNSIHTHMHTYIPTNRYIHTCRHTCMHACTYMHGASVVHTSSKP